MAHSTVLIRLASMKPRRLLITSTTALTVQMLARWAVNPSSSASMKGERQDQGLGVPVGDAVARQLALEIRPVEPKAQACGSR